MGHHLADLARLPSSELEHVFRYGETPDFAKLDGFVWKGANLNFPGWALFPRFRATIKSLVRKNRASVILRSSRGLCSKNQIFRSILLLPSMFIYAREALQCGWGPVDGL